MSRALVRQVMAPTYFLFNQGDTGNFTPNPLALHIEVKMTGGGGGGGAGNTASGGFPGTNGTETSFGGSATFAGLGGGSGGSGGGAGGGVQVGAEVSTILTQLAGGQGGNSLFSGTNAQGVYPVGAIGGSNSFGGQGTNGFSTQQPSQATGYGGGGAGGGGSATPSEYSGAGGGAGGYFHFTINKENFATFAYSVGGNGVGNGGTGSPSGNGGPGVLIIREIFQ